ncbi:MAG TPA: polysaccharide biosynthesis C-terminal domain-containing protein [Candidatus Limnocylindrales bacterium]|nr:polysaccharide biosynthesis C-terminal domain-containing protein [Candidatus Limnocylindrales bacterium]
MALTRARGRGRGFATNVMFLAAARVSTVAAFFAVSVVAARLLPAESVGSAAVGQTVGMIAALIANGGLNIATIYFLQQRPDEQDSIVPRLTALAIAACAAAVLVVLASAPVVFGLVVGQAAWPLLISAAIMGAAMIAFEFSGALLLGLGRPGSFTLIELVRGWGSLLAVGVLLLGPWQADGGLVLGLALGYAAAAAMGIVWTDRGRTSLMPRYDRRFSGEVLSFGLRGQVGNIFQFLGVRLDLLLVPALLDLRAAGIYFVAVRMSDVVGQAATAASSLIFPHVAAQQDRRATRMTERATRTILLIVAGSALLLALTGEFLLQVAFGPVYRAGTSALLVLLLATLPLAVGRVLAADLKGRGRPGLVSGSALVAVIATVSLDLVLIPAWGIVGAAAASLAAYGLSTVVLLLAYRHVTRGRLLALVPRPSDVRDLVATIQRSLARRDPDPT